MKKLFFTVILLFMFLLNLYSANEFINNGDGTVSDNSSNLMWQASKGFAVTWQNAKAYCSELTLGGYTDWRLPTLNELETIVDRSNIPPAVDSDYFQCLKTLYWTSTEYDDNNAWCIHFYYGFKYWRNKNESNYIRCVRETKYSYDCSKYTDKESCESNSNCMAVINFSGQFEECVLNCSQFKDETSCVNGFDGNSCKWVSFFGSDVCTNK